MPASPAFRSQLLQTPQGLELRIPPERRWFTAITLGIGILLWLPAGMQAVEDILAVQTKLSLRWFLILWLPFWTTTTTWAVTHWFWNLGGVEVLHITPQRLTLREHVGRLGRMRSYPLAQVKNFRVLSNVLGPAVTVYSLAFDMGGKKPVRFGKSLSEEEMKQRVAQVHEAFPVLR